jgi:hypothetical protein
MPLSLWSRWRPKLWVCSLPAQLRGRLLLASRSDSLSGNQPWLFTCGGEVRMSLDASRNVLSDLSELTAITSVCVPNRVRSIVLVMTNHLVVMSHQRMAQYSMVQADHGHNPAASMSSIYESPCLHNHGYFLSEYFWCKLYFYIIPWYSIFPPPE